MAILAPFILIYLFSCTNTTHTRLVACKDRC